MSPVVTISPRQQMTKLRPRETQLLIVYDYISRNWFLDLPAENSIAFSVYYITSDQPKINLDHFFLGGWRPEIFVLMIASGDFDAP